MLNIVFFFSHLTIPHEQFHMPLKINFDDRIKGWIIISQLFPPFDLFMLPISAFIDKAEINNLEFEASIVSLIESPWQIPGSRLEYSQGSHTCYLITVHKNAPVYDPILCAWGSTLPPSPPPPTPTHSVWKCPNCLLPSAKWHQVPNQKGQRSRINSGSAP